MKKSDLSPSEAVLRAIGLALFPVCDSREAVTRSENGLPSPLVPLYGNCRSEFDIHAAFQRLPLNRAVRGDGIVFQLGKLRFWGIVAGITAPTYFLLTPSANGVTLLRVEAVSIREIRRYVS